MGFIVRPSEWEVEHAGAIFAGQAYQAANNGALPDTPMWRMLEFRHALNPARFNHWHPNVGLILEQGEPGVEAARQSILHSSPPHGWIGYMRGPKPFSEPEAPPHPTSSWPSIPQVVEATPSVVVPPLEIAPPPPTAVPQVVPEPSAIFQGMAAVMLAGAFLAGRIRAPRRG